MAAPCTNALECSHQASPLRNAPHLAVVRLADQLPRAVKVLVVLEQCGVQRRLGAVHVRHHQHLGQAGGGEGSEGRARHEGSGARAVPAHSGRTGAAGDSAPRPIAGPAGPWGASSVCSCCATAPLGMLEGVAGGPGQPASPPLSRRVGGCWGAGCRRHRRCQHWLRAPWRP